MSIDLPQLEKVKDGYNRSFFVIRIHGDAIEKIEATIDNNKAKFKTDRFSTYALAYTDTVNIGNPNTGILTKENQGLTYSNITMVSSTILIFFSITIVRKRIRNK